MIPELYCISKVVSIEHRHVPGGLPAVNQFMISKGYTEYIKMTDTYGVPNDVILVRNDLLDKINFGNYSLGSHKLFKTS